MLELEFRPIDLAERAELCVAFRRDTYACGFGERGQARFNEENGAHGEQYLSWLAQRLEGFPEGHVHAFHDGKIVGQIEMIAQQKNAPTCGYVNLFYLVPEARGSGLGTQLHDYAVALATLYGSERMRLSVSPTNARAMRFYEKHGWRSLGPSPGFDHLELWEIQLGSALREQR